LRWSNAPGQILAIELNQSNTQYKKIGGARRTTRATGALNTTDRPSSSREDDFTISTLSFAGEFLSAPGGGHFGICP